MTYSHDFTHPVYLADVYEGMNDVWDTDNVDWELVEPLYDENMNTVALGGEGDYLREGSVTVYEGEKQLMGIHVSSNYCDLDTSIWAVSTDSLPDQEEEEIVEALKSYLNFPKFSYDHLALPDSIKHTIDESVISHIIDPESYRKTDTEPKNTIIHGKSGVGKTWFGKVANQELGDSLLYEKGITLDSKGSEYVEELFSNARLRSPSIIYIDDIHELGKGTDNQAVGQIIQEIDGVKTNSGVRTVGTTRNVDSIPNQFLDYGIFDFFVEFPDLDQDMRKELLEINLNHENGDMDLGADNLDLDRLAEMTEGFNGRGISSLVDEAVMSQVGSSNSEEGVELEIDLFETIIDDWIGDEEEKPTNPVTDEDYGYW